MPGYRYTVINFPDTQDSAWPFDTLSYAHFLNIEHKTLSYLCAKKNFLYTVTHIPKKSGHGQRTICAPSPVLKHVLRKINTQILNVLQQPLGPHVCAYRPGVGVTHAAQQHRRGAHHGNHLGTFIKIDLENFFDSTQIKWVSKVLREKLPSNVANLTARLCTFKDRTPQGAPTSGALCNLVAASRLDPLILKTLTQLNTLFVLNPQDQFVYTRYSDDLMISCGRTLNVCDKNLLVSRLLRDIRASGYAPNLQKLRVVSKEGRKTVLGLTINRKINVPRETYERLKAIVHNSTKQGLSSQAARYYKQAEAPELTAAFFAHIQGQINYYHQINPAKMSRLKTAFDALRP